MLKKTISYTDYNGDPQVEDFYFHLSKSELGLMDLTHPGGMKAYLDEIVKSEDGVAIIQAFKAIIAQTIGVRSEDGRRFEKSDEITKNFMQTAAYEEFFMDLVTNANSAVEFVKGILPVELVEEFETKKNTPKDYSPDELMEMSHEDFVQIAGNDPKNMTHEHLVIAMARKNSPKHNFESSRN